jgi:hypothetical protein
MATVAQTPLELSPHGIIHPIFEFAYLLLKITLKSLKHFHSGPCVSFRVSTSVGLYMQYNMKILLFSSLVQD